jgi:hypothetical protein
MAGTSTAVSVKVRATNGNPSSQGPARAIVAVTIGKMPTRSVPRASRRRPGTPLRLMLSFRGHQSAARAYYPRSAVF